MKRILVLCSLLVLGSTSATEAETVVSSDGFYVGAGVEFSRFTNQSEVLWASDDALPAVNIQKRKINKVGGTFAVGYGKCLAGRYYIGGELSLDISGNKSYNGKYAFDDAMIGYQGKLHGIVPSAVVRLGCYLNRSTMAYVRVGGSYVKSDFDDGTGRFIDEYIAPNNFAYHGSKVNISKLVPVVGVGIERKVCGNFGLRLEGDYRFNSKHTSTEKITAENSSGRLRELKLGLRNRIKNYTVRLMATYHF